MFRTKGALAFLSLLPLALIWNCQNGGSELPNEVTGALFIGNKPAVGAKVELFSVNYVPDDTGNPKMRATTKTDRQGAYSFKDIPPGDYNVIGSLDSLGSFRDSVSIRGPEDLGADTLKALGALSGTIRLQPQDNPRSSIVQVIGTDRYVNVDADGRFDLPNLAAGYYQLRLSVDLDGYIPLFATVAVRAGIHDTLAEPLVPFYSGIPYVPGIKAALDTLHGVAKITWNRISYQAFHSYVVFRDSSGILIPARNPLNTSRLTDTVYFDTLYPPRPGKGWDTTLRRWEYRVSAQAANGKTGYPYEVAELNALPPSSIMTAIDLRMLGAHADSARAGDTIRIVAKYSNPTYANLRLAWFAGTSDTLRWQTLTEKSGEDTLAWPGPESVGERKIAFGILDAAGRRWTDSLRVIFVESRPIASAGADTTVPGDSPFILRGKAKDSFGKIVKWEWDIGGTGTFSETRSGDTAFTLPKGERRDFPCILRVTNDHGIASADTVHLEVQYAWMTQNSGTQETLKAVHFPDGKNGWAVGANGVIVHTADGGGVWSAQASGTSKQLNSVFFADAEKGWAVGDGVILRTTNGGVSWTSDEGATPADLHSVTFMDTSNGWAVGETCCAYSMYVLHTSDGGKTWIRQSLPEKTIGLSAITFLDPGTGWFVGGGSLQGFVFRTIDSGKTWLPQDVGIQSLGYIRFVNEEIGWTGDGNGRLYRTVDGGDTWSSLPTLPITYPQSAYFPDPASGWVAGFNDAGGRIFRTLDGGVTWSDQKFGAFPRLLFGASFIKGVAGWIVGSGGAILKVELTTE